MLACRLTKLCSPCSRLAMFFTDGNYQGPVFQKALTKLLAQLGIAIVKCYDLLTVDGALV